MRGHHAARSRHRRSPGAQGGVDQRHVPRHHPPRPFHRGPPRRQMRARQPDLRPEAVRHAPPRHSRSPQAGAERSIMPRMPWMPHAIRRKPRGMLPSTGPCPHRPAVAAAGRKRPRRRLHGGRHRPPHSPRHRAQPAGRDPPEPAPRQPGEPRPRTVAPSHTCTHAIAFQSNVSPSSSPHATTNAIRSASPSVKATSNGTPRPTR